MDVKLNKVFIFQVGSSTHKPTPSGDDMATGSDHEELWVATPRVDIKSSSRPYHELVSPGVSTTLLRGHHVHSSSLPPFISSTQAESEPSSTGESEDEDTDSVFPTHKISVDIVTSDQYPSATTPIPLGIVTGRPTSTFRQSPTSTKHPPYIYNEGYTSPRPILFKETPKILEEIDRSHHNSVTESSAHIFGVGTYTYPGFPSVTTPSPIESEKDKEDEEHKEEDAESAPVRQDLDRERGKYGVKDGDDASLAGIRRVEAGIVKEVCIKLMIHSFFFLFQIKITSEAKHYRHDSRRIPWATLERANLFNFA